MRKAFAEKLIALFLLAAGLLSPCAVRWSVFEATPAERMLSRFVQQDVIPARENEVSIRLFARRNVQQPQKSFFCALYAFVSLLVPMRSSGVFVRIPFFFKHATNKFLVTLQFLQTLF